MIVMVGVRHQEQDESCKRRYLSRDKIIALTRSHDFQPLVLRFRSARRQNEGKLPYGWLSFAIHSRTLSLELCNGARLFHMHKSAAKPGYILDTILTVELNVVHIVDWPVHVQKVSLPVYQ